MLKFSTTEPDDLIEPKLMVSGPGAKEPVTVASVFSKTVKSFPNRPAMKYKRKVNNALPEEWSVITFQEYWDQCFQFAKTLVSLGFSRHRCVNILGFNSPEWFIANNGTILAGGIPAGIYTSNLAEACHYITNHSKAEVVVVEDNKQLEKYANANLPNLKAIVVYAEAVNPTVSAKCSVPVYNWSEFLGMGSNISDEVIHERIANTHAGHCVTLIYTSGTTGPPKAVMLSNDNITWTLQTYVENFLDSVTHDERMVSYLPLSHIAAQLLDIHFSLYSGCCVYFAQPDALKGSLTSTLKQARPTYFFGVPRVWEKIQEKMVQMGRETTGVKKMLSTWAKGHGTTHIQLAQFGNGGGAACGYGCANALILMKIKEALGLDQCKACFTAAAPISVDTLNYFASLDLPVYELFGQSECTGPHTSSRAGAWKIGYCGRPMPGTETIIAPGTNELCYRGRHIFMGYMYMPEQTASTIDENGFLHSGDVAEFDGNDTPGIPAPSGFMKITGRIKELIITAGGENIPPVLIENEMKAAMVALSNVLVVGDRRKYLAMLVSLKCEVDKEHGEPTDTLAADALFVGNQIGSTATTMTQAAQDPKWIEYITNGMKAANKKTTSNAQIVQKWKMLPRDFSEKQGELTPTLKLKRNVVCAKYEAIIESLYEGGDDA